MFDSFIKVLVSIIYVIFFIIICDSFYVFVRCIFYLIRRKKHGSELQLFKVVYRKDKRQYYDIVTNVTLWTCYEDFVDSHPKCDVIAIFKVEDDCYAEFLKQYDDAEYDPPYDSR